MTKSQSFALLGDVPIIEGSRHDLLQFESCATVLANAAIETKESITIGIFGKWGTGKTSMMRLIMEKVKQNQNAVPVWFNAWQYEKEDHLIVPLTATITRRIDEYLKDSKWSGDVIQAGKKLRDALRAIAYGFSIKGKVGIPLVSEAEVNLSAKDMIERYQDLTKDSLLARSLYFDAFDQLSKCNEGNGDAARIVVFIDDLDRCFPNNAVELLENVKLVLNQPGFSFILGVHDEIITEFVKTKYAKEYSINPCHFEDYLDKIVQVKVPVPERAPGDMKDYVEALLSQTEAVDKKVMPDLVTLIAESCNRNPRSIVRLLNRVMVTVRIGQIDKKDYDPVALILDITTDSGKFRHFKSILDDNVQTEGEGTAVITFGNLIASSIKETIGKPPSETLEHLRKIKLKSRLDDLQTVIAVFNENPHILTILKTEQSLKWLINENDYRNKLKIATQQTVGEKEKPGEKVWVKSANPIDQIERNMVKIPEGKFLLGGEEFSEARPIHEVFLKSFEIGAMPITQEQYEAVMKVNPSSFKGDINRPVENVSWEDADAFCKKLSEMTRKRYSLPTEAQWEYACRAGEKGLYCFGNNENELTEYAWFDKNSEGSTQPVGKKKPNKFGLYDMHGNVWEWCADWYDEKYYEQCKQKGIVENPQGPETGSDRVLRGGSWLIDARLCRCACRSWYVPCDRYFDVGFRVVFVP